MAIDLLLMEAPADLPIQFTDASHFKVSEQNETLVQKVIKYITTELGSNLAAPTVGSNIMSLIKDNYTKNKQTQLQTILVDSLQSIEANIISEQVNSTSITKAELLDRLELLSLTYNDEWNGWDVTIRIINQLGESSSFIIQ